MLHNFKKRFFVSLVLTIPLIIISDLPRLLFAIESHFYGRYFLLFILSTLIYGYGGWPFFRGMYKEIKTRRPGMMTLVGLAITVAYLYSGAVAFGLPGKTFFWELATLIDIMLLGHWIEMRSVMGASKALYRLAQLLPANAHLIADDGSITDVPISQLQPKNKVLIKPGEKIPADGTVVEGSSTINEAMLTGESQPVNKSKKSSVIAGTINGIGSLTILIEKTSSNSYISFVIALVEKAQKSKSLAQDTADKAAYWLTIIALGTGGLTFFIWFIFQFPLAFCMERMVTVMIIACPHALGLAIPLVIAVMSSLAAQQGLLIRNRIAFEQASSIDTIVFDKTGTLTTGIFEVTDILSVGDWKPKKILQIAASVEQYSEHPIGQSIVQKAKLQNLSLLTITNFKALAGKGIEAQIDGITITIGQPELAPTYDIPVVEKQILQLQQKGVSPLIVLANTTIKGVIGVGDSIRKESIEAIRKLKQQGIQTVMLTGDDEKVAQTVGRQLGIATIFARVLPDQKVARIKKIQQQGKRVAMVGDGINDAPALMQADLGIAIGSGTDVAQESGDIILVKSDPRKIPTIIALSGLAKRKMIQNILWATIYNVAALPLAAGVLYPYGIILSPAIGALIMSVSTVIVAINSRLINFKQQ